MVDVIQLVTLVLLSLNLFIQFLMGIHVSGFKSTCCGGKGFTMEHFFMNQDNPTKGPPQAVDPEMTTVNIK